LLAIAVRTNVADHERLGSAFMATDIDGDGRISKEDLEIAVSQTRYWWDPDMDVDVLIQSANLDHHGGLSFTEFVAACLYAGHQSIDKLIDSAFTALDADRDGKVAVREIRDIFRERDAHVLQKLPQNRPFSRAEWCQCVGDSCGMVEARGSLAKRSVALPGFAAACLCTNKPRTLSLEGTEDLDVVESMNALATGEECMNALATGEQRLSIDSDEVYCHNILDMRSRELSIDSEKGEQCGPDEDFNFLAILRRLWPFH
jgi:Ca2+-binding EF-hand superfamily protein